MNKTKKKVLKLLEEFKWLFQFQNYELSLCWAEKDEGGTVAEITVEEDYQRILLKIFPRFFKESPAEQRKTLVHELSHFLTNPLYDIADSVMEGKFQTKEHLRIALEKSTCQVESMLDSFLQDKSKFAKEAYKNYLG